MPSMRTTAPSTKPSVAAAVPGIGPGTTVSPGVATGRGLQRLTTEMPGITQLVAPTVTVSSTPAPQPPPSSLPSASQPAPANQPAPVSPLPPGTGTASLSWTLNSETALTGYKIYVGTASGIYNYPGSPFVLGVTTGYTITGLPSGQTYYFAISAYDYSGSESGLSAEVSKSIY
ncbi:MAG TPA: fibronectin type III domain-containing protein [Nitrospira sp.]|nr:fibronectin type III domain-containing protein [Nitrospira sp.]